MSRIFKTEKRIKREAKYRAMYEEYCELVADPKNDKMAIMGYLTKKHHISQTCIYNYLQTRKTT